MNSSNTAQLKRSGEELRRRGAEETHSEGCVHTFLGINDLTICLFSPWRSLRLVSDNENKPRGYAFIEYEREQDMKNAYKRADGT